MIASRRAVSARLAAMFGPVLFGPVLAVLIAGGALADDPAPEDSLAGQLLVAAEDLRDPNFSETVIYMVEHSPDGAMGLVVNVPIGQVAMSELLDHLGLDTDKIGGEMEVHYGGPVDQGRAFVLHSTDVMLDESVRIDDDFALTARPDMLDALARGEGPKRSLFALGYAGWGPGQLESELARDTWVVVPAQTSLVFAEDPKQSWRRAIASWGIDL